MVSQTRRQAQVIIARAWARYEGRKRRVTWFAWVSNSEPTKSFPDIQITKESITDIQSMMFTSTTPSFEYGDSILGDKGFVSKIKNWIRYYSTLFDISTIC